MSYVDTAAAELSPRTRRRKLARKRFLRRPLAVAGLVVALAFVVAAIFAPQLVPYDPNEIDVTAVLSPPTSEHWLGTDELGRDELRELLFAGQISLRIGVAVAIVSTLIGATFGAIAGFYGRWIDQLLMRTTDLFLIVPAIATLAIALRNFGSSPLTVTLVLAGLFWMWIARVVRARRFSP